MIKATSFRCAVLLPLLLLWTPHPVDAQFGSAIQGTITDSQQAVVPDARVRVLNTTTGVTRDVVTSADGVYRAVSLGPGQYTVEVEKRPLGAAVLQARQRSRATGAGRLAVRRLRHLPDRIADQRHQRRGVPARRLQCRRERRRSPECPC
jgi:hypothetical protein